MGRPHAWYPGGGPAYDAFRIGFWGGIGGMHIGGGGGHSARTHVTLQVRGMNESWLHWTIAASAA